MNCAILNNQRLQCSNGKLEQISSFEELEFRNFMIRNGSYFVYSDTSDKHRSLPQVQINDDPVPRFLDGKWIRGKIQIF